MSASPLSTKISEVEQSALAAIANAVDASSLKVLQTEIFGKKSEIAQLRAQLGKIADPEERKSAGQSINGCVELIEATIGYRLQSLLAAERSAQVSSERMDLSEFLTVKRRGTTHIVTQATERLEDVFIGLGFQIAEGPEVETDFYNFEALNMPKTHPARSEFDTMFIEPSSALQESNSVLLRTHTSPVQIRVMQDWEPPIYAVMPGRVFRRDTPDATHMPVFHQIEGMVIDKGITFAHLA